MPGAQEGDRPGIAVWQYTRTQRGNQARAQHRRLTAARWADERQRCPGRHARHKAGNQPLATEEELRIVGLEGREALERARRRRRAGESPRALARSLEVDDAGRER